MWYVWYKFNVYNLKKASHNRHPSCYCFQSKKNELIRYHCFSILNFWFRSYSLIRGTRPSLPTMTPPEHLNVACSNLHHPTCRSTRKMHVHFWYTTKRTRTGSCTIQRTLASRSICYNRTWNRCAGLRATICQLTFTWNELSLPVSTGSPGSPFLYSKC